MSARVWSALATTTFVVLQLALLLPVQADDYRDDLQDVHDDAIRTPNPSLAPTRTWRAQPHTFKYAPAPTHAQSLNGFSPSLFVPRIPSVPPFLRGTLSAPAPFPIVLSAVAEPLHALAPGIRSFRETLFTTSGPLVINGILADPRAPGVHFQTILAHDHIASVGEATSSMAQRTGAIAGINGDYFAIRQTNEPLGIVINNGALWKTPSARVTFSIDDADTVRIMPFQFHGTVAWDTFRVPLTGVNLWPPDGGASLILSNYGIPRWASGVHFLPLAGIMQTPQGATYRVLGDTFGSATPNTLGLALGPAALKMAEIPAPGTTILIQQSLTPDLAHIQTAIGGGPQLLDAHEFTHDEYNPINDESGTRYPLSGLGQMSDGEVLLLTVDGRSPSRSVGLTRPEFAALFASLDAADAMCLDSGGSTTLVARDENEPYVHVLNSVSSGYERRVGDGFFVYTSTEPPAFTPTDGSYDQLHDPADIDTPSPSSY